MSTLMRCCVIKADGTRCLSTRQRTVWWITDPWNCGKHRKVKR